MSTYFQNKGNNVPVYILPDPSSVVHGNSEQKGKKLHHQNVILPPKKTKGNSKKTKGERQKKMRKRRTGGINEEQWVILQHQGSFLPMS